MLNGNPKVDFPLSSTQHAAQAGRRTLQLLYITGKEYQATLEAQRVQRYLSDLPIVEKRRTSTTRQRRVSGPSTWGRPGLSRIH